MRIIITIIVIVGTSLLVKKCADEVIDGAISEPPKPIKHSNGWKTYATDTYLYHQIYAPFVDVGSICSARVNNLDKKIEVICKNK